MHCAYWSVYAFTAALVHYCGTVLQPTRLVNCNLHALQYADSLLYMLNVLHCNVRMGLLWVAITNWQFLCYWHNQAVTSNTTMVIAVHLALAYNYFACMMLFARCLPCKSPLLQFLPTSYLFLEDFLVLGPFSSCICFAESCRWLSVLQVTSLQRAEVSVRILVHMLLLLFCSCIYYLMPPCFSFRLWL